MKLESLLKRNRVLVAVAAMVVIVLLVFAQSNSLSIGYLSGTQGLEPQFHSVRWNGVWWSSSESGKSLYTKYSNYLKLTNPVASSASLRSFGYSMQLDPDESQGGMPDLCASTQAMTRDSDTPVSYSWTVNQGTKTLGNGTVVQVVKQFELYKYRMDWAMNLWLTGSEWESDGKYEDYPDLYVDGGCYSSGEVWIKLVPQSFVYFNENPDRVYFAPCYIALKEPVSWIGVDKDGKQTLNDQEIAAINDIIPEATGESIGIYYQRGGGESLSTSELLNYQGLTLDSSLFRSEYWTRINLVEFQAKSWSSWGITHGWKYPSAHLHFLVDLFVVGEWTIYYKTGEIPEVQPHLPVVNYDILTQLGSWFTNPVTQVYLWFILAVVVLLVIAWRMPWLLKLNRGKKR